MWDCSLRVSINCRIYFRMRNFLGAVLVMFLFFPVGVPVSNRKNSRLHPDVWDQRCSSKFDSGLTFRLLVLLEWWDLSVHYALVFTMHLRMFDVLFITCERICSSGLVVPRMFFLTVPLSATRLVFFVKVAMGKSQPLPRLNQSPNFLSQVLNLCGRSVNDWLLETI